MRSVCCSLLLEAELAALFSGVLLRGAFPREDALGDVVARTGHMVALVDSLDLPLEWAQASPAESSLQGGSGLKRRSLSTSRRGLSWRQTS